MASSKLRSANENQGEDAKMDMSPMIDMVFLLLLFFLVVSKPKTIKIDTRVVPPVAKYSQAADTIHGKVVVNIHQDGTFLDESMKQTFANIELLSEYLKEQAERVKGTGNTPVLHIRADKRAPFKYCQRAIKAGASAGITLLAYGAYNKPPVEN